MNYAIEIKNLSFTYEGVVEQLKKINLSVGKGEVVVITGPSGGGKSTLTRVINGLVPYFYEGKLSGEVFLFGKNLNQFLSWERGRYIGNVFQDPRSQFFANETAGEIAFGCENYGFSHEAIVKSVRQTAEELKIDDILEEKVRYLSYGMRQRVAIASAKAIDPPIYVMDEPSANLDMKATFDLGKMIEKLKEQGKTVLIAEHRLYYLREIADRIIYVQNGEILSELTPSEMLRMPEKTVLQRGLRSMELGSLTVQSHIQKPEAKSIFEVNGLHKRFGNHTVADNINFSCKKGEVVAIVGPNAAGKSTLGKILSGLLKEDSGTVRYKGKRLTPTQRRGLVWYIMQDLDSQLFGEDLMDELLTGKKTVPERVQKAERILKNLELFSLKDRHPATLSGGQKQRLALGVALMNEAPVIILDEPTSGLDGKNMRKVSAKIKQLAAKGHIILMITHDIECALSTCNRALYIKNSCLAEDFVIKNPDQLLDVMR